MMGSSDKLTRLGAAPQGQPRRRRIGAGSPVLGVAIAMLTLLGSAPVAGMERTIVLWPSGDVSGATDTQALQEALLASRKRAVIELQEGTFFINRPLTATNFRGVLRGVGMDRTVITTVGELPTSDDCPAWSRPPGPDNPWPAVITFDGGNFALTDLQFSITEFNSGQYNFSDCDNPDGPLTSPSLLTIVLITGDAKRTKIERVILEGGAGPLGSGVNLVQALYHIGLLGYNADTGFPGMPASGQHFVRDSVIRNADTGATVENMTATASVSFHSNVIEAPFVGFFAWDTGGQVNFSRNRVTSDFAGVTAAQGANFGLFGFFPVPSDLVPLKLTVRDNDITVNPGGIGGVVTWDLLRVIPGTGFEGVARIDASIDANRIVATDAFAGIVDAGSVGTKIRRNRITGTTADAGIRIGNAGFGDDETIDCEVRGNIFNELTAGVAPIHLGALTAGCSVLTDDPSLEVLDDTDDPTTSEYDGNNRIIGLD